MESGWLIPFLDAYVESYDPAAVSTLVARVRRPWTVDVKGAGKRWIYWGLHKRGVAYGLPLARPGLLQDMEVGRWQEAFAPFLSIWCDLIVELEAIATGTPRTEGVREWICCCLAAAVGADAEARRLYQAVAGEAISKRSRVRAERQIEARLKSRRYVAGNPLLGLPLRNGFVYSDARLVGRIALRVALDGRLDPEPIERLRTFADRERRLLVAALCALVARGEALPGKARRIAAGQLQRTGLPRELRRELKRLLDDPPSVEQVAQLVEGRRAASYLIEQLLLAAYIDGNLDDQERAFIDRLAEILGVPPKKTTRIELRVGRFFAHHRDLFDLFTETQYYGQLETVVREQVTRLVLRNLDALVTEIYQTGELAALLTKAAAGQKLDDVERAKVREQLLDIVRALPSLALFTLPGGALLLPIVLRLLPWDLRPSAFRAISSRRPPR